jgi:hypothetical protein
MAHFEVKSNKAISETGNTEPSDMTKWTKQWIEISLEFVSERLSDMPRTSAPYNNMNQARSVKSQPCRHQKNKVVL